MNPEILSPELRSAAPTHTCTWAQALPSLLRERIVRMDRAMGTMIQLLGLTERHFRGERFERHTSELKAIVTKRGDTETHYTGMQFLIGHTVPDFYFHVVATYTSGAAAAWRSAGGISWEILDSPRQRYCMPAPAQLSRSGRTRTTATAVGLESDQWQLFDPRRPRQARLR